MLVCIVSLMTPRLKAHARLHADLLDLMPRKEFYYNEVLDALPGSGDDWDAAQRFHFAACLALDGNERAKRVMYESYNPGPKKGGSHRN